MSVCLLSVCLSLSFSLSLSFHSLDPSNQNVRDTPSGNGAGRLQDLLLATSCSPCGCLHKVGGERCSHLLPHHWPGIHVTSALSCAWVSATRRSPQRVHSLDVSRSVDERVDENLPRPLISVHSDQSDLESQSALRAFALLSLSGEGPDHCSLSGTWVTYVLTSKACYLSTAQMELRIRWSERSSPDLALQVRQVQSLAHSGKYANYHGGGGVQWSP